MINVIVNRKIKRTMTKVDDRAIGFILHREHQDASITNNELTTILMTVYYII